MAKTRRDDNIEVAELRIFQKEVRLNLKDYTSVTMGVFMLQWENSYCTLQREHSNLWPSSLLTKVYQREQWALTFFFSQILFIDLEGDIYTLFFYKND